MTHKHHKLIVISSGYPNEDGSYLAHTFVQGYVNAARHSYKVVEVIAILPYRPFLKLRDYSYENVNVHYRMYPYAPVGRLKRDKGKIAFSYVYPRLGSILDNVTHIYANFTETAGIFADLLAQKLDMDYVLNVNENRDWLIRMMESGNPLYENAWRHAKSIIRVNVADCELMRKYNPNVVAIPNGFDPAKFNIVDKQECRSKLGIPGDARVIVNIAFYLEKKNQTLLIRAISDLDKSLKSTLKVFLIGGGPMEKDLREEIEKHQLGGIIELTGQVKHDRLNLYLNSADIFCLPSNSEGNPTVMFEALGVGIPYVGTDAGGVPDIITSDEYGFVSPVKDQEALSQNIARAFEKKWDRDAIAAYAKNYTWDSIYAKTIPLF